MLINLCALLGENKLSQVTLPTNSEAEQVLTVLNSSCSKPSKLTLDEHLVIGKYYVTLITEGNLNTWYIASCEGRNDDQTYAMDHLVRVRKDCDLTWKHPPKPDVLNLHSSSIMDWSVNGEWDVSNERCITFRLKNHAEISEEVMHLSHNIDND